MLELSLRRGPKKIAALSYVRYTKSGQKQIWENIGVWLLQRLEAERYLQVDPAIRSGRGVRTTREVIGLAEERRTQIADGRGKIDVIENVSRRNAERQIVAAIAGWAIESAATAHTAATAAAATAAARPTWPTAERASGSGAARSGIHRFFFLPEPECFAEAQVQRKPARTRQGIDGYKNFPRLRNEVERTIFVRHHVLRVGLRRRKRRPVVEDGITIQVLPRRDVKGDAGLRNEKWIQTKIVGQRHGTAKKNAVAHVKRSAPIIETDVVVKGRKSSGAGGVAVRVV